MIIHRYLHATSTVVQIASVRRGDLTSTHQYSPEAFPLSTYPSRPYLVPAPDEASAPKDSLFAKPTAEMSQYLRPLSIPSRHNSTCDESPYSISPSSPSSACPTPCTAQKAHYFLNIPGMQTQQNIKDADGVDKLANAAVSQGKLRPAEGGNIRYLLYSSTRNHTLRRCFAPSSFFFSEPFSFFFFLNHLGTIQHRPFAVVHGNTHHELYLL